MPVRCGSLPRWLPMPRLTLGSRKYIGSNCAWQSVMCSRLTLSLRLNCSGRSYGDAARALPLRPSAKPAAAAAPSTLKNSRLFTLLCLLVFGRDSNRRE